MASLPQPLRLARSPKAAVPDVRDGWCMAAIGSRTGQDREACPFLRSGVAACARLRDSLGCAAALDRRPSSNTTCAAKPVAAMVSRDATVHEEMLHVPAAGLPDEAR